MPAGKVSRGPLDPGDELLILAARLCSSAYVCFSTNGCAPIWLCEGRRIEEPGCIDPFHGYALESGIILEVPDASRDTRFSGCIPRIAGKTLLFFAAIPLVAEDDEVVATLAVLDESPRHLTELQRADLAQLAQAASSKLSISHQLALERARLESAPVGIYHTDSKGQIIYANREYRRLFGFRAEESIDDWAEGVHVDDRARMQSEWLNFCENPKPSAFQFRSAPRAGGSRVLTEQVVAAIGVPGFLGTITDITERVKADANHKRAETLFETTFEQAPIGIIYADPTGMILRKNPAFCVLLGLTADPSENLSLNDLTHDTDRVNSTVQYQHLWSGQINVIDREARLLHADGHSVWVRATTALLRHENETPPCAVMFIRDITARKQLSDALIENKQLLETVIADIPLAIRACDAQGEVFLHNSAAVEFFAIGTDPENPEPSDDVVEFFLADGKTPVPKAERPLARALRGDTVMQMELILERRGEPRRITRSSARRLVSADGECLGAVAVTTDVTQIQRLARDRAHSQKLESIGELSAGIAHEINTPTQFIGNNIAFLKDSVTEIFVSLRAIESLIRANRETITTADIQEIFATIELAYLYEEVPKAIEQSIDGIARIQTIVGAMKEFSHPAVEKTAVDINRSIQSTIIVASNEWKYVAELKTDLGEVPPVSLMPGSFNQVILNMIVNAAHAIVPVAEGTGARGLITVSTRLIDDSVEIVIEDTGSGIPEEIRNRIFDPFFTTKAVGKGTGQGLAIAHDVIVKKHGGTISVDSTVGVGTRFVIRLPIIAATS